MNSSELVQVDASRLAQLEEMERKQKLAARRAALKTQLLLEKAKDAGIKVSKEELDAKIKADDAKKVVATTAIVSAVAEGPVNAEEAYLEESEVLEQDTARDLEEDGSHVEEHRVAA